MGVIWRLLRRLAAVGAAVLAVTLGAVVWQTEAMSDAHLDGRSLTEPVDAVIVLGAGVEGDGRLAYSSRRRAEAAARLLAEGRTNALIFSGGLGLWHPETPAGALMRDLAAAALPPGAGLRARMAVEPNSRTTFENLRFSFAIAEAKGYRRLALLSDPYHLARAERLAAYFGQPGIGLVAAAGFEREGLQARIGTYLREAAAWWYNLGKVAVWEALTLLGVDAETRGQVVN